jgi:hypothetical protein
MSTATETEAMQNIRINNMRHIAARFLNETKALNLERDLVDFLINIDRHHQVEVEQLKLQLHMAILNQRS